MVELRAKFFLTRLNVIIIGHFNWIYIVIVMHQRAQKHLFFGWLNIFKFKGRARGEQNNQKPHIRIESNRNFEIRFGFFGFRFGSV